jgi:NADH-quinone oxidoreductase subunit C
MTDTSEEHQPEVAAPAEPPTMYGARRADVYGQIVLHVTREQYVPVIKQLLDDGHEMCIDLTAVDYLAFPTRTLPDGIVAERFEIIVNLLSMGARRRVRLRVQVPGDDPVVPTLFDLYPGTEAFEREVYDMFGITFTDHPDLTRILMPEDCEGYPLRKDYEVGEIPVQFTSPNPGHADRMEPRP